MDDIQRAIEMLKEMKLFYNPFNKNGEIDTAISAMQELQQYRKLEQECVQENHFPLRMLLQKWKEFTDDIAELYRYRQIGTPEECRDAMRECKDCKYKIHSEGISELHDCNDCGRKNNCSIRPGYGKYCRINCYAWTKENQVEINGANFDREAAGEKTWLI